MSLGEERPAGLEDRLGQLVKFVREDEEGGRGGIEGHAVGRDASREHETHGGLGLAVEREQLVDDRRDLLVARRNGQPELLGGGTQAAEVLGKQERPPADGAQQVEDGIAAQ